jgi:hypothetical protein
MIGTTTVEVFTLSIAAVAAVASVAAVFIGVLATKSQSHRVWIRDLRVRLYSSAMESTESFGFAFAQYSKKLVALSSDEERRDYATTHRSPLLEQGTQLLRTLLDVGTFGTKTLAEAADRVAAIGTLCLTASLGGGDLRVGTDLYQQYWESVMIFRMEVRRSMAIPED